MGENPVDLKYSTSHEWVRIEGGGTATVGITDYAQDSLGDVVYVELPEIGCSLDMNDEAGVVESVKAASDIFAPISGEVVEINELLEEEPDTLNRAPYGEGWLFRIKLSDPAELEELLDADAYLKMIEDL